MTNKLKIKFVLFATISVSVMLSMVVIGATIFNYMDLNRKTDQILLMISENNGILPKPNKKEKLPKKHDDLSREAMFDTRYFVVYLGEDNEILYTDTGNVYATNSLMAQEYAVEVLNRSKESGYLADYKYLCTTIGGTSAIIFLDASRDIDIVKGFLYSSTIIAIFSLFLVAIISYFLSPIAIKPITESYEKQRKFITNASHEIKTPLTVISANLDIIEMSTGESKWLKSSKEQIIRLDDLLNNLIALSRMEESESVDKKCFSISELCEMVLESYDSIAKNMQKTFETDIKKDISYIGNEKTISQLCYILLDNAFKYSNAQGKICFTLCKRKERVIIIVENTVEELSVGNHNEFFDRFYRVDISRNTETGGYGIGLSLAKSIVEKHKGKISAKSIDGKALTIEVIL